MRKLSWAPGRIKEANERDGGDRRAPVSGWTIADELFMLVETRGRAKRRFLSFANVIPLANFLARTITSGILSRVQRRLRRHVETRKRLGRIAAPGKRPSKGTDSLARCKLRWNCGEIRYVYPPGGLCGASSPTVTRACDYIWIVSSPASFPPYGFFPPSYCRIRGILRGCVIASRPSLKTQEDLLHNPLLKSSYVVIFGRNQYVVRT